MCGIILLMYIALINCRCECWVMERSRQIQISNSKCDTLNWTSSRVLGFRRFSIVSLSRIRLKWMNNNSISLIMCKSKSRTRTCLIASSSKIFFLPRNLPRWFREQFGCIRETVSFIAMAFYWNTTERHTDHDGACLKRWDSHSTFFQSGFPIVYNVT